MLQLKNKLEISEKPQILYSIWTKYSYRFYFYNMVFDNTKIKVQLGKYT